MLISLGLLFRMPRVTLKHQAPKTLPHQTNAKFFPLPCCGSLRGQTSMTQQCQAMLATSSSAVQHGSTAVCGAALNMALGAYAHAQSHS